MALETVIVRVLDDQGTPQPVENVLVRILDDVGNFVTEALTAAFTGEATFLLEVTGGSTDYQVLFLLASWSFSPSPLQSITVTSPPSPPNDFEFTATQSITGEVVKFVVKDGDDNPVDGVLFQIFDSGDNIITEATNGNAPDASGELTMNLEGDPDPGREYIVRLSKPSTTFENGPTQKILVLEPLVAPATNIFDFVALDTVELTSTDPDMCTLSGYLRDASRRPLKKTTLRFIPVQEYAMNTAGGMLAFPGTPSMLRGDVLLGEVKATTRDDGLLTVELPRGGKYNVHIYGAENPIGISDQIEVPDAAGWDLENVLFPYVSGVTYDTDPINVLEDETVEVGFEATISDGRTIDDVELLKPLLLFLVDDETVASVSFTSSGVLSVTGLVAGSTTLEVERVEGTFAPRRPELDPLAATPPTIQVT